jgi:formylglycine-generating enzyme required for sulfatase activity
LKYLFILLSLFIFSCSSKVIKTENLENNDINLSQKVSKDAIIIYINSNGFIIDDNLEKSLRLGFEEIATKQKYVIIDDEIKEKALQRIKKDHAWAQNDPRFLIELGKQVSASKMVFIDITKFSEQSYKLSNRWINLATGVVENTKTFSFNHQFNNETKEILFGEIQRLASYFLTKQSENRIIISIESEITLDNNLKKIITLAFEEIATDNNYSIVDYDLKEKAYKQILKDHNWSQNDPKFLLELNKQLSAIEMVVINITKQGSDNYLFSNKLLNLKSGLNIKTTNRIYNNKNDKDYVKLFDTIQKLANNFLCKNCVEKKEVYLEFKGSVLASNEYVHVLSSASEVLTKEGYLISKKQEDADLIFSVSITKKDNESLLSLNEVNKKGVTYKTIVKKCEDKEISVCVKSLFTKKFQQKEVVNDWKVKFVEIPKGEYFMGYNAENALPIEKSAYKKVKIANDFFIANTETTQKFYTSIMGSNPSKNVCENCPVDSVSFNDITEFINKLNQIDKKYNYRLPSEAEWEYAARIGQNTPYFWGDTEASIDQYAWYGGNSDNKSHEIATKKANSWGLFDVAGNLFEMTSSFIKVKVFDKSSLKYVYKNLRIAKGGGFSSKDAKHLRSTIHIRIKSEKIGSSILGFRLVLEKK